MKKEKISLKQLEKLFDKWDNGYYDPYPRPFRRFSKGLFNLMSFCVNTIHAYSMMKSSCSEDTILPGIIDEHFSPRLFELSYIGAWAVFEDYLKDIAWLKLSENSKVIADEFLGQSRGINGLLRIYKNVLGFDLMKYKKAKSIFDQRRKRNRIVHSGMVVGYSAFRDKDEEWPSQVKYAATKEEARVTEELFCNTLANMWQVGDLIRKKLLKLTSS